MNFIFLRIISSILAVYKYPHKRLLLIFRNTFGNVFLPQQQLFVYFFHILIENCLKALQLPPSSPTTTQKDHTVDVCKQ